MVSCDGGGRQILIFSQNYVKAAYIPNEHEDAYFSSWRICKADAANQWLFSWIAMLRSL